MMAFAPRTTRHSDTLLPSQQGAREPLSRRDPGKVPPRPASAHLMSFSSVTTAASPYATTSGDDALLVDATAGACTINLPTATTRGRAVYVKKTDATANAVNVTAVGGDTVDGAGVLALGVGMASVCVVSDGVGGWWAL